MSIHRRLFMKFLAATGLATGAKVTTGCTTETADDESGDNALGLSGFEYVVVGSGAGGGPLAANLARAGHKVLLLEAGEDRGGTDMYQVPAFHVKSTEDPSMKWDFFVKHYSDEARAAKDSKRVAKGILYPRAGTLGGCTAHNAMVTVYPHESDWNTLADITGDDSYRAGNMRRYYEILERCEYLSMNADTTGHGLRGWLGVNKADARLGLADFKILQIVKAAAMTAGHGLLGDIGQLLGLMNRDLNAPGAARDAKEGLYQMPLAVNGDGRRNGPREFLLDTVRRGFPLTIKTGIFVTRVLFSERPDAQGKYKATGVEFMEGKHLYRADPNPSDANPARQKLTVKREVILAAGAFNTPQILKLSGVGPKEELTRLRIPVKVDLPGVGTNLQDRYEVGIISEVKNDFALVNKCTFGASTGDPCLDKWREAEGPYTTNGIAACIVKRSSTADHDPDLFVFGGPAFFKGYYPGYSKDATRDKKHFTWAVLKAHTHNTAGTVTLKTTDPRDVPEINFKYFDEGTQEGNASQRDVDAVVDGILVARDIGKNTADLMLAGVPLIGGRYEEQVPGPTYKTREQLREFVKNESWGHHASCTCKMGKADDPTAVLDSRFRVRGTTGLRVVDASVFPKIPGFFIVVPIYMISEKATDVLLEDIGERRRVG